MRCPQFLPVGAGLPVVLNPEVRRQILRAGGAARVYGPLQRVVLIGRLVLRGSEVEG